MHFSCLVCVNLFRFIHASLLQFCPHRVFSPCTFTSIGAEPACCLQCPSNQKLYSFRTCCELSDRFFQCKLIFFFYLIFTFMKVSTCDWSEEVTFISCKFNKLSGKSFCSLLKSATGWTTSGCSFNAAVRTARAERRCCCVWSCCLLVWGSLKTLNSLQGPVSRHCFPVP